MKKLLIVLMLTVSSLLYAGTGGKALVGSFNVLRLGQTKKDYKELTDVISMMDIVGLVEVSNQKGIKNLVKELNKNTGEKWDYHLSPKPVGTKRYKEYYGYVWKKNKVKFVKSNGFYKEKRNEFIREPYGATFKVGKFDFTLIMLHAIYGDNRKVREAEVRNLPKVYDYFQNQDMKEQDIIIAGDFNLPVNNKAFKKIFAHKDRIISAISPNFKTTIGHKGFANQYDTLLLSQKYTGEYTGNSGRIDTTKVKGFKYTRKYISDHTPVYIEVDTTRDDD